MRSKQFSPLLRGSGPDWSSNFKWYGEQLPENKRPAPEQPHTQHSRYIIHERSLYRTVPKTYTTNKGAILLYTSEDYILKDTISQAVHPSAAKDMDILDLDNLQKNILQFGANQVDAACMRFTRPSSDDVYLDERTRPGALPEVYLEDLKYKTRILTKVNKLSTPRLRATERVRSARSPATPPPTDAVLRAPGTQIPTPPSRPPSGAQKRKLLRPPSAPPQPMPSVEKRKIEIIRDQLKHLDAAQRREKMKFADFELVSTIPDHFTVKGLGGKSPKRRAHSSPVYKTKFSHETYVTSSEDTKSLPLFVVTSSPGARPAPYLQEGAGGADRSLTRTQESITQERCESEESCPLAGELDQHSAQLNIIAADITRRKRGATTSSEQQLSVSSQSVKAKEGEGEHVVTAVQATEATNQESQDNEQTERCHSSRQIILDLQDKPKESFISDDLRQDVLEQTKCLQEGPIKETSTTSTTEQKGVDDVSTSVEDSLQNMNPTNRILTYPSFLSLSSANSKETQPQDEQSAVPTHESDNTTSYVEEAKREALQDAKTMVQEISHSKKSKKKRCGTGGKDSDGKKKTIKSARSRKSGGLLAADQEATVMRSVSDGEFKEKQPPKSLVAMHRDNIDSTSSIPRKKSTSAGLKKKKISKLSEKVAWDITRTDSDNDDVFHDRGPQTMLLDDDPDDMAIPSYSPPRQRKRLERPSKLRLDTSSAEQQVIPSSGVPQSEQNGKPEHIGTLIKGGVSRTEGGVEDLDEETLERIRQEEREKELKSLELLERRIGMEDGSLKRLGEKVEIIEKETIQQKEEEAALRQLEYQDELARKEEERKAYEEVMKAQEAEYERHLQNMLKQEEERNIMYLNQLRREEVQRDIKRKLAMFRQSQNLELRQHVRLTKLKQKLTVPFKYSYFPILKVNYLNIVNNDDPPKINGADNGNGKRVTIKNKKLSLKRV